jgi:hypothetical protein
MVSSFCAYLLLSYWTSPGRIPLEMIRFCFFSDTKYLRSIDVNKNLLRNEQAVLRPEVELQRTPAALPYLPLHATAAAVD